MSERVAKPLGIRAYGSIPHLPGSRRGPADIGLSEQQARIATTKTRDRHDVVIVEEKLDGSCVAVANIDGSIVPLIRAGYNAWSAHYAQHRVFAQFVVDNEDRFRKVLTPGERLCGEWMIQAHGTRYALPHEPFVVFDLMTGHTRASVATRDERIGSLFVLPRTLWNSASPCSTDLAMRILHEDRSEHGALEAQEGCVWRVERRGVVNFLAKFVRDKVDGLYLPGVSGLPAVLNTWPAASAAWEEAARAVTA